MGKTLPFNLIFVIIITTIIIIFTNKIVVKKAAENVMKFIMASRATIALSSMINCERHQRAIKRKLTCHVIFEEIFQQTVF
jgi:hypothetical protein